MKKTLSSQTNNFYYINVIKKVKKINDKVLPKAIYNFGNFVMNM